MGAAAAGFGDADGRGGGPGGGGFMNNPAMSYPDQNNPSMVSKARTGVSSNNIDINR